MPDRLYVHITWTTRDRTRSLDRHAAAFLSPFLAAVARQERARVLELGIVQTHLHLVRRLHPTTCIPRLLQRLKGGSSVLVNREGHITRGKTLQWAKGYNIQSISPGALETARAYVRNQPAHHPSERIEGWPSD